VVNKNILQKISDQEMDRKDFLKYSGIALLGVVGLLFRPADQKTVVVESSKTNSHGFGSGKYGA
jgi:hypothetical protein